MDQFEPQYNRFKTFILASVPESKRNHQLLLQMQTAPFSMFLLTLISKKNMDMREILGDLLTQLDLEEKDIEKEHLDKLWRYLSFFTEIAKQCIPQ